MTFNLRSFKSYSITTLADVSRALAFIDTAIRDALTQVEESSAPAITVRNSDRTDMEGASLSMHLFTRAAIVRLPPMGKTTGELMVTNLGSGALSVLAAGSDKIFTSATLSLAANATLRLRGNGGGIWG